VGSGLFLQQRLSRGALVGEYTGVVRDTRTIHYSNPYLSSYASVLPYCKLTIDALHMGSLMRFINHSSQPNVEWLEVFDGEMSVPLRVLSSHLPRSYRLAVVATRDIQVGEQLLVDYGPDYWRAASTPPEPLSSTPTSTPVRDPGHP
jgi:SET domain-containing protein